MLNEMRIAVCGDLPTTCDMLRKDGISHIDTYADGIQLWFRLRKEKPYHLILIHSQVGAGMTDLHCSYKERLEGEPITVPVMLLSEPAYSGELDNVRLALRPMAKAREAPVSG